MHRMIAVASDLSRTVPPVQRAKPRRFFNPATAGFHLLMVLALATTTASAQEPVASQVPSIVTSGEAIVRRAPDQAVIYASVETRARNPRDAQRQNADSMTVVQKQISDAGIAKDAVRT